MKKILKALILALLLIVVVWLSAVTKDWYLPGLIMVIAILVLATIFVK